jgi:hypothetical protein
MNRRISNPPLDLKRRSRRVDTAISTLFAILVVLTILLLYIGHARGVPRVPTPVSSNMQPAPGKKNCNPSRNERSCP